MQLSFPSASPELGALGAVGSPVSPLGSEPATAAPLGVAGFADLLDGAATPAPGATGDVLAGVPATPGVPVIEAPFVPPSAVVEDRTVPEAPVAFGRGPAPRGLLGGRAGVTPTTLPGVKTTAGVDETLPSDAETETVSDEAGAERTPRNESATDARGDAWAFMAPSQVVPPAPVASPSGLADSPAPEGTEEAKAVATANAAPWMRTLGAVRWSDAPRTATLTANRAVAAPFRFSPGATQDAASGTTTPDVSASAELAEGAEFTSDAPASSPVAAALGQRSSGDQPAASVGAKPEMTRESAPVASASATTEPETATPDAFVARDALAGANASGTPALSGTDSSQISGAAETSRRLVSESLNPPADLPVKFAAAAVAVGETPGGLDKVSPKSFVATNSKELTRIRANLGIGVAQPSATMPVRSNIADSVVVPSAAPTAEARSEVSLPQPIALTSTAHRAVEAVLSATDRFSARDQHSVNLQFTVGGSDLNVRVELKAGEVHTTFRTDSPELREAIAHEWQSLSAQPAGDRAARLANPVFTTNEQSSLAFTGDGASRQREQPAHSAPSSFASGFAASAATTSRGTATTASSATVPRTVSTNSVHLHTLA